MKKFYKTMMLLGACAVAQSASAEATWEWMMGNPQTFLGLQRAAAIMADFNNDDMLDIYVAGNGWNQYYNVPGAYSWQPQSSMYYNQCNHAWDRDIISVVPRIDEETGEPVLDDEGNQVYNLVPAKHNMAPLAFPNFCVFDFNNDGLLDILVGGQMTTDDFLGYRDVVPHVDDSDGNMFCALLYKNRGDGTFELMEETGIPVIRPDRNGGKSVYLNIFAAGDYDHDGYTDLALSGNFVQHDEDTPGRCAVLLRNLDGTGKFQDMKIATTIGGAWTDEVVEYDEEGQEISRTPGKELPGWFMPVSGNAQFADVNNDGWLDLIFSGWASNCQDTRHSQTGSNTRIYINKEGKSFNDETAGSEFYMLRASGPGIADFDGDGYLDIVNIGWGDDGSNWSSRIFFNAGEGAEEVYPYGDDMTTMGLPGDENFRARVRDFDGDGNLDVLYDGKRDSRIYYGDGTGAFVEVNQLPVRGHDGDDGIEGIGDVNGDGLAERFQVGYNWVSDNSDGKYDANYRDADHYNIDGDWVMDASLWINKTDADVEAPAAPTNVAAVLDNGVLTVTWDDIADAKAAYNIVLTNTASNEVIAVLPANIETGFVKVAENKYTAVRPGVGSYSVNVNGDSYKASVQAISLYSETYSPFVTVTAEGSGISSVNGDNSNAPVEYFNVQGMRISEPTNGMYIRRQGNEVVKVYVK